MLPTTHRRWVEQFLDSQPPPENRATCHDCAMQGRDELDITFGRVKCCTYVPTLPNFLVGEILGDRSDEAAKGRRAVLALIHKGDGVSPFGLLRTLAAQARYDGIVESDTFGFSNELECPFYRSDTSATCGIWSHRNAVCATWFCRYERGHVGQVFWSRLRDVLSIAESAVQHRCVLDLISDPAALALACTSTQAGTPLDTMEDPLVRARVWGSWLGREAEYYEACAERARQLAWPDILALAGVSLELQVRLCVQAAKDLQVRIIPSALRLNLVSRQRGIGQRRGELQIPRSRFPASSSTKLTPDKRQVQVCAYSPCDPFYLPANLFQALHKFDGGPVSAVLEALAENGIQLDDDLLGQLVDFRVLVDPQE